MKKIFAISVLTAFVSPAAVYAEGWLDTIVEAAKEGNGVYVESHSSVSTGGQTSSGGSVVTGDASASSHTETYVSSSDSDGTVDVRVETSKNGETEVVEYSETIDPNEGVSVEVEAIATDEETNAEVRVDGEIVADEASTTESGSDENTASAAEVDIDFLAAIPHFFKKIIDWFW